MQLAITSEQDWKQSGLSQNEKGGVMLTERLESMSPRGYLRLYRQEDGDILVSVGQSDGDDGWTSFATVEFCTPFSGGGGSEKTWNALCRLMVAMAEDNVDEGQGHRRPPNMDVDMQQKIVQWGEELKELERWMP